MGGGAKIGTACLLAIPAQGSIVYAFVIGHGRVEEATDASLPITDEPQKRTVIKFGKRPR